MKTFGSRAEVLHGNAKKTTGNLTKDDLKKINMVKLYLKLHQKLLKKLKI